MSRRVLLLVGSAKRPASNSEALGTYLVERMGARGAACESLLLHTMLWSEEGRSRLCSAIDRADVLVLAFPVYVDTLPYLVTRTLELAAEHRLATGAPTRQRLACIVNCGFPEARHCDTAVAVCRRFARETGLEWAGALALGGGEAIAARPLREVGGMARNVVKALDLTADAIAAGDAVPDEAIALMAKPFVPHWVYRLLGGYGWIRRAKAFGARDALRSKPFVA